MSKYPNITDQELEQRIAVVRREVEGKRKKILTDVNLLEKRCLELDDLLREQVRRGTVNETE